MQLGLDFVNDELWKSLRTGQKKGVESAFNYLAGAKTQHSCLISLPTGAGKTGVIATVAHFSSKRNILILCHRSAVKDQILKQLSGDFFKERIPLERIPLKSVWSGITKVADAGIYVTTFQKLSSTDAVTLKAFTEAIDLIIIDEGHSEPSPVWSKISRSINAHKIIITATPYRNDLFKFDVSPDCSFIYTFKQALEHNVLCSPSFENLPEENLVERVKVLIDKQPGTKCIIKCRNHYEINRYEEIFSRSYKTIAIHQQFAGDGRENFKSVVPKALKTSDYQVIIHQRKLDEGVDIPSAKVLVITYPVSSGRELVQTVGRIVRKSGEDLAHVLDLSNGSNARLWNNFIKFDEYLSSPGAVTSFLKSLDTSALLKSYLDSFPEISYFDSGYKKKFNIAEFDPEHSLKLPLASLCFINKEANFSLPVLVDSLYWKLVNNGELVTIQRSVGFSVITSISFNNSKFLSDSLFFEPALQVIILREAGDLLVVYDSRGINYAFESELGLGSTISLDQILALAARTKSLKTKSTTSFAIGDAKHRPEGISWRGKNLEAVNSSQANASYAISTLLVDNLTPEGTSETSYYLGVGSGRVSDQKKRNMNLAQLSHWIDDIHKVIESADRNTSPLLNSFAKPVNESPSGSPTVLLLDLSTFETPLDFTDGHHRYTFNNDIYYVQYNQDDNVFLLASSDNYTSAILSYSLKTKIPRLNTLKDLTLTNAEARGGNKSYQYGQSANEILSDSIVKVLYQDSISYYSGSYYKMRLPTELGVDIAESNIGKSLHSIKELQCKGLKEKGDSSSLTENLFPQNSVFSIIDKIKDIPNPDKKIADLGPFFPHVADLDFLLCTDLGTEPADFIASTPSKLIYVHVKCADVGAPHSSAGALAMVGTQAIKNLEALTSPNADLFFANWNMLKSPWRTDNAHPDHVKRLRLIEKMSPEEYMLKHGVDYDALIDHAWNTISNRRKSFAVEKEIWIVVGNAFSKKDFYHQIRLGQQCAAETLQAFQLIDSWLNTLSTNEVSLRLFVSE
ncbi:hypothetical protein BFW86_06430 [Pseudomonas fluorescens]|nr:hypothetical protein BFW86_06430 [Pseudomonas fluorescens]